MTSSTSDMTTQLSGPEAFEITRLILQRAKETDEAFQMALARVADANTARWMQMQETLTDLVRRVTEVEQARKTEHTMRAAAPPWIGLMFSAAMFCVALVSLYLAVKRS